MFFFRRFLSMYVRMFENRFAWAKYGQYCPHCTVTEIQFMKVTPDMAKRLVATSQREEWTKQDAIESKTELKQVVKTDDKTS